jgi:hypothetical protein
MLDPTETHYRGTFFLSYIGAEIIATASAAIKVFQFIVIYRDNWLSIQGSVHSNLLLRNSL